MRPLFLLANLGKVDLIGSNVKKMLRNIKKPL
nr:MAG TPA: hypothetical protein [Caudoviricetes sp.]